MTDQDGLPTPRRHYATLAIMATLILVVLDGAIARLRPGLSAEAVIDTRDEPVREPPRPNNQVGLLSR